MTCSQRASRQAKWLACVPCFEVSKEWWTVRIRPLEMDDYLWPLLFEKGGGGEDMWVRIPLIQDVIQKWWTVRDSLEARDSPTSKLPDGNFSQARLAALAFPSGNSRKAAAFSSLLGQSSLPVYLGSIIKEMVDGKGFEPSASALRTRRSPS